MKQRHLWLFVVVLVVGLAIGGQTRAASDSYTLVRGVVSQSSVLSAQGGPYQLQGSVGQPFTGGVEAGELWLGAGHWYGRGGTTGGGGGGGEGAPNLYLPSLSR